METNVFVMTHKKYNEPELEGYKTLHVGRMNKEDLGYCGDNTGDNISELNDRYCELTGLYWLWKNYTCDNIGICHYRRFFMRDGKLLDKEYIEDVLSKYDLIIPSSGSTEAESVYEHYKQQHIIGDLDTCRDVILEMYPDFLDAFDHVANCNLLSVGNMIIAPKRIFDEYCKWLFDVLFEVERRIHIDGRDQYQKRVMGFLSERLLRVWLINSSLRIKEEDVQMVDVLNLNKDEKIAGLAYKLAETMTMDLVNKYNKDTFLELSQIDNELKDDKRIPVWLCWWQGLDNAPPVVKECAESIKRNIDSQKYVVKLIDFGNYSKYVTFSNVIVDKFNNGKISLTHLSDILQMQLLYRYGGLWIDSNYFVADTRVNECMAREFFTIRTGLTKGNGDIAKGRWSKDLIKITPGSKLCGFMVEAFERYWELRDDLLESMVDAFIGIAYDNMKDVGLMIDGCDISNTNTLSLSPICSKPYNEEKYKELNYDTYFFKLHSNEQYASSNIVGNKTFYGKLLVEPKGI